MYSVWECALYSQSKTDIAGLFSQAAVAVAEEKAERRASQQEAALARLVDEPQLSLVLRNAADSSQKQQMEFQGAVLTPPRIPDPLANWSSPESLQIQRNRAVAVLRESQLLHDADRQDSEPQFNHLEHDRTK